MGDIEQSLVYMVDQQMRIIYFNSPTKKFFPEIQQGAVCHEVLGGSASVCDNCPLYSDRNPIEFYNKYVKCWFTISTGMIEWSGKGPCYAIVAKPLYDSAHSLDEITTYEELMELNLTAGTIQYVQEQHGKYAVLPMKNTLADRLAETAKYLVHPEDRSLFEELWSLTGLSERLKRAPNHMLRGRYRRLLTNGEWRWVVQSIVSIQNDGIQDQVLMAFLQDLEPESGETDLTPAPQTGLYNNADFFQAIDIFIRRNSQIKTYCLVAIDVEHFKLFNEWYGRATGDGLLSSIAQRLNSLQEQVNGIAGYMGNDDFAILLPNQPDILQTLQDQITGSVKEYGENAGFLPAFGVYAIQDEILSASAMYDRACLAQSTIKGNYARRICWYHKDMMLQMENDHLLLSEIQSALEKREFTFYAQPQYNMLTGRIVGLESLVRWVRPNGELVSPAQFIPTLEKNGFIGELDWYVWEEVCRHVRHWLDKGYRVVPVSVNVSQVDIYTMDVVQCFQDLIKLYELDPKFIQIEITESAYAEEYEIINNVVRRLQAIGFTVLMDDFGSGYTSLNILENANVDILKLDMKYIAVDEHGQGKSTKILNSIVNMAQMAGLRLIAEGIDHKTQVDFLVDMGCIYGQGYYFQSPLPITELEDLLATEEFMDYDGIQPQPIERLQIHDLLRGDFFSESVVNNILGGIAIFEVENNQINILQANEQFQRIVNIQQNNKRSILDTVYEADRENVLELFQSASENILNGAEGDFRYLHPDGTLLWLHLRIFFLREQNDTRTYYGSISDITHMRMQEQRLISSQQALASAVSLKETESEDKSFINLSEENRRMAAMIFAQLSPSGMIGGYCEKDMPLYFANRAVLHLMGYESYEECAADIDGKVINTIHPEDRKTVLQDMQNMKTAGMEYTTTYRMRRKDGSWFWTLTKGRVVKAEDGRLAMISACTDITETMTMQQQLVARNAALLRQNQELYFLNHDMPGGYHRCTDTPDFRFLYISNQFLEMFGYTREELRQLFDDKLLLMVHPEDRSIVIEGMHFLRTSAADHPMEYRMRGKQGYIWVINQSRYMKYEDKAFIQGVVTDVTETVELRNRMRLLMEYTPENIVLIHWRNGQTVYEIVADGLSRSMGYTLQDYTHSIKEKRYMGLLHKEDEMQIEKEFNQAVKQRKDYHSILPFHTEDGRHWWSALDACYIKDDPDSTSYLCINRDVTAIKQQEQALWVAGQIQESILRQAGINGWEWDIAEGALTVSNNVYDERLISIWSKLGEPRFTVIGFPNEENWYAHLSDGSRRVFQNFFEGICAGKQNTLDCEVSISCKAGVISAKTGDEIWLKIACEIIRDNTGAPLRAVGYYKNITEQKIQALRRQEDSKMLELLRGQAAYALRVDLNSGKVSFIKDEDVWLQETGYPGGELFEDYLAYLNDLLLPDYHKPFMEFMNRKRLLRVFREGQRMESIDYQRRYQGEPHWMRSIVHLVRLKGQADTLAYIFVMDINAQKLQELQLTRLAEIDALTGLYNRQSAVPRIQQYLSNRAGPAALIMLDLDNFKSANDVFGHAYGDTMIAQTASSIRRFFREDDVVCRLGGDEFMVLCKDIADTAIKHKLQEIVQAMEISYQFNGKELKFSMSIGYVMYPEQGTEFDDLYQKADVALFATKLGGKSGFRKFDPEMKTVRYELADSRKKADKPSES